MWPRSARRANTDRRRSTEIARIFRFDSANGPPSLEKRADSGPPPPPPRARFYARPHRASVREMSELHPTLSTVYGAWPIVLPEIKLRLRARLPGAFSFDAAARGLRAARAAGVPAEQLLAAAMAGSWLVNSAIRSPVMQKWLTPAYRKPWEIVIAGLEGDALSDPPNLETRANVEQALEAIVKAGAPVGAVTKVLSLIVTEPIPLMPDAAVAHVLRAVPIPTEPDAQTAPVKVFFPMIDRVRASTKKHLALLSGFAHVDPSLRPGDVMDRLLWFDSIGYRNFRNDQGAWAWTRRRAEADLHEVDSSADGADAGSEPELDEAVVFVPGAVEPGTDLTSAVDLPGEGAFAGRAAAALDRALAVGVEAASDASPAASLRSDGAPTKAN